MNEFGELVPITEQVAALREQPVPRLRFNPLQFFLAKPTVQGDRVSTRVLCQTNRPSITRVHVCRLL